MFKLPLTDRVVLAAQLAIRARAFYDIWRIYETPNKTQSCQYLMGAYSQFFRSDNYAHLTAMIVHIAMLHDKPRNTINLGRLIKETRDQLRSDEMVAGADLLLKNLAPLVDKVLTLRHNVFAHRNDTQSADAVFKDAAISGDQIANLIDGSLRIANKLLVAVNLPEQSPNRFVGPHTRKMLKTLWCGETADSSKE